MHKKYILLSMVSREKNKGEPIGRNILSLFYDQYPSLAPQFANYYEPVNKPVLSAEAALQFWEGDPGLYRRKNSIVGSWYICSDGEEIFSPIFRYNWDKNINWYQLFQQLVTLSKAYFGYVHIFTENEIEGAAVGSAVSLFLNGITGYYLKKGIPQLGWGHYFGEEYVNEIDLVMLKEHGFSAEKLGEGYTFHITEQLSDVINNFEYFDERRKILKSLFRPTLFQKYARYEHEN